METQILVINNKEYLAYIARTEEEKEKGLQGVEALETDSDGREEGMLFLYDKPQHLDFWMKDCDLDLSIIFLDENGIVISNKHGIPNSEELISEDNAQFVFECNATADINVGDEMTLKDSDEVEESNEETDPDEDESAEDEYPELQINHLIIYGSDGQPQGYLSGGERIFSRKSTRVIIRKAKRAYKTQSDTDYKALGRYVFNEMKAQDTRDPEYVNS